MSEEKKGPGPLEMIAWGILASLAFAVPLGLDPSSQELSIGLTVGLIAGGAFVGTRSPESRSAMFGALGALMIWSAVSYAAWQLYLWNLGREMERALNQ